MKNYRKYLSVALCCCGMALFLAALVLIARQFIDDRHSQNTVTQLQDLEEARQEENISPAPVSTEKPSPSPESWVSTAEPTSTPEPTPTPTENPYRDSYLANGDMVAWLQIPDTIIDYPVMWTPGDETYYLRRAFDGSKNQNGCLILDTDSCLDPLTTNLIIHGHNMDTGTMFGTLAKYAEESYYQEHKLITLYTEKCQRNYEIIAVFRSQVYKKSDTVFKFYKFFQADTQEEFDDFYENIMALSIYDTGVTAEFGDHFLTLSTCSYHVDRGRFVVVAKEIENGPHYLPFAENE